MKRGPIIILSLLLAACFAHEAALEGAKYTDNLKDCNRQASTLCESIACENRYRAQAGRFPRDVPAHCKTIKAEGSVFLIKDAGGDE